MVYLKITLIFFLFLLSLFLLDYLYFLPVGVILLFFLNTVEKEARQKQHAATDITPAKKLPFVAPVSVCPDKHPSARLDRKSEVYAVDKNSVFSSEGSRKTGMEKIFTLIHPILLTNKNRTVMDLNNGKG
jgi:hypothetical protein